MGGVLILGESVRLRPPLLVEYIEDPEFMTWCLLVGEVSKHKGSIAFRSFCRRGGVVRSKVGTNQM